jgi:small nuclear ribonucleoprotein (snRNP)-like protein
VQAWLDVAAERGVWPQLVELKNGETYNGHMVQCDSWMNVHLREVICTSKVRARHTSPAGCPAAGMRLHELSCGLDGVRTATASGASPRRTFAETP